MSDDKPDGYTMMFERGAETKYTSGTIAGNSFSLHIDGDAPDELVAQIESALADVKAEVEE